MANMRDDETPDAQERGPEPGVGDFQTLLSFFAGEDQKAQEYPSFEAPRSDSGPRPA